MRLGGNQGYDSVFGPVLEEVVARYQVSLCFHTLGNLYKYETVKLPLPAIGRGAAVRGRQSGGGQARHFQSLNQVTGIDL